MEHDIYEYVNLLCFNMFTKLEMKHCRFAYAIDEICILMSINLNFSYELIFFGFKALYYVGPYYNKNQSIDDFCTLCVILALGFLRNFYVGIHDINSIIAFYFPISCSIMISLTVLI